MIPIRTSTAWKLCISARLGLLKKSDFSNSCSRSKRCDSSVDKPRFFLRIATNWSWFKYADSISTSGSLARWSHNFSRFANPMVPAMARVSSGIGNKPCRWVNERCLPPASGPSSVRKFFGQSFGRERTIIMAHHQLTFTSKHEVDDHNSCKTKLLYRRCYFATAALQIQFFFHQNHWETTDFTPRTILAISAE